MPLPYESYYLTWTGDGNAKTLTPGFKPKYLKLDNVTDRIADEKYKDMLATETLHTVAGGTRTLATSSYIVLNDDGTVTIAAAANINAKVFHCVAHN